MKYNRRKQSGFTLIELMISVAVIGILAAIALPQYQMYVARSQATRVVAEAAALRLAVEICVVDGRTAGLGSGPQQCDPEASASALVLMPVANSAAPNVSEFPAGAGVPAVTFPVSGTAEITSTFGNGAALVLAGETITWSRDAAGVWSCDTTVLEAYRPSSCF